MIANTKDSFYLTERYQRKMYKDIVLNELITFVFYFVFNILFKDHPQYSSIKSLFMVLFAVIAAGLLILGKRRADRIASIHYELQKKGLEYFDGKKTTFYSWDSFKEIKRNPNRIGMLYPYEFHTENGVFALHRQLDNPDLLIKAIGERTGLDAHLS